MYLNAFDKFLQDPNISMNPLNVVPAYNKNSVLPLSLFYHNHGYNTFVLLDNDIEANQTADQLKNNKFSETQIIFFERDGNLLQSIEDYMIIEDYLYNGVFVSADFHLKQNTMPSLLIDAGMY